MTPDSPTGRAAAAEHPRETVAESPREVVHALLAEHPRESGRLFWDPALRWRRLLAELVGTLLLTLVAAGGDTIEAATHQPLGHAAKVVAPALMVTALIYAIGGISGAHLNPAVTLAFAVRGDFPPRRALLYLAAQACGAMLAALALIALFGNVGHLGATLPHLGSVTSLAMEVVLTATLVLVILCTAAAGPRLVGHNSALAVGATIALLGLFASPVSGASMNPARSLGPALIGGRMESYWIYLAGPVAGALIAVALATCFYGRPSGHEQLAAAPD
ncbi:MAG: MIP/aquaporin family protein [Solirubrobacteraceae bacterium]